MSLYVVLDPLRGEDVWLAWHDAKNVRLYVYLPNVRAFVRNDQLRQDFQSDQEFAYYLTDTTAATEIMADGRLGCLDRRRPRERARYEYLMSRPPAMAVNAVLTIERAVSESLRSDSEALIEAAKSVAYRAHKGQVDKAGRQYFAHPEAVASKVSQAYPGDFVAIATAWLHDVVEDTPVTSLAIREQFGDQVADAVDGITRRTRENPDEYYARVAANPASLRAKRADLEHNSDPDRLAALPVELRARLSRKYVHAAEVLDRLGGA